MAVFPPVLNSISPNQGQLSGGNTVALTGSFFQNPSSVTAVNFGSTPATAFVVNSDTSITAAGTVFVSATNVAGDSGTTNPNGSYTYTCADLKITQVSSTSGVMGQTVTITCDTASQHLDGTNCNFPATVTGVSFGFLSSSSFSQGTTSITAVAPDFGIPLTFPQSVTLTVFLDNGSTSTPASFGSSDFTYVPLQINNGGYEILPQFIGMTTIGAAVTKAVAIDRIHQKLYHVTPSTITIWDYTTTAAPGREQHLPYRQHHLGQLCRLCPGFDNGWLYLVGNSTTGTNGTFGRVDLASFTNFQSNDNSTPRSTSAPANSRSSPLSSVRPTAPRCESSCTPAAPCSSARRMSRTPRSPAATAWWTPILTR